MFFKDDTSVLFLHVPKTGGSTIEKLFTKSGWKMQLRQTNKTHPRLFPMLRVSPQHLHAELLQQLVVTERCDFAFMITREPLSRFRSEYAMRHDLDDEALTPERADKWANRMLKRYENDPYVLDNHLRPQHEFRVPGTTVYRLEDGMESIVADLRSRGLDLGEEIPHRLNSTQRRGRNSSEVRFSDRMVSRVQDFYGKDYEEFGYPR